MMIHRRWGALLLLVSAALVTPVRPAALPPRILLDLDPGGMVWSGLDVDDDLALLAAVALQVSWHLAW